MSASNCGYAAQNASLNSKPGNQRIRCSRQKEGILRSHCNGNRSRGPTGEVTVPEIMGLECVTLSLLDTCKSAKRRKRIAFQVSRLRDWRVFRLTSFDRLSSYTCASTLTPQILNLYRLSANENEILRFLIEAASRFLLYRG
jgi:hypothetical protein